MTSGALPQLDFTTFVLSLVASAQAHLGEVPGPDGSSLEDLELARQDVELLQLLEDKTKGNLTGEEDRLLHHALIDLRVKLELAGKLKGKA